MSSPASTTTGTGQTYLNSLGANAPVAKTANKQNLDQNSFLKLLTTQMKTQDPTAPVDNTQMVAQLAQFSSVAGISEMNATLKAMGDNIAGSRLGGAASWIGRSALVASDIAVPQTDGSYAGEIALPADAKAVQLTLTDATGTVVHQENFSDASKGSLAFTWDGKGRDGAKVPGPLKIGVQAFAKTDGSTLAPATAVWTGITGVESPASGTTKLNTSLGAITPGDTLRLS